MWHTERTASMPLECFIAMAFGNGDTDTLYDDTIVPLLKQRKIVPFRVDRSLRNEDIDDQILTGLQRCDFVMADLTYARPSVYYEAGVAFGRKVPVIFTARGDHFQQQPDDRHGNFRVHFDLQMKPIVGWTTPDHPAFIRRLAKRLDHVIRPLLKDKQASAEDRERAAAFAPLPLREKLARLTEASRVTLTRLGFKKSGNLEGAFLLPPRSKQIVWCDVGASSALSKSDLGFYHILSRYVGLRDYLQKLFQTGKLPRRATAALFLFSLHSVPASRVAAAFPHSRILSSGNSVIAEHKIELEVQKQNKTKPNFWSNSKRANVPIDVRIIIISGLKHERMLECAVKQALAPFHS